MGRMLALGFLAGYNNTLVKSSIINDRARPKHSGVVFTAWGREFVAPDGSYRGRWHNKSTDILDIGYDLP